MKFKKIIKFLLDKILYLRGAIDLFSTRGFMIWTYNDSKSDWLPNRYLYLYFPLISVNCTAMEMELAETTHKFVLSCPTMVHFFKGNCDKGFTLRILGFGFFYYHQWSY